MLLSSFLGLGCGVMLAGRALRLTQLFPALLFILVIVVFGFEGVRFEQGPDELRFLFALRTKNLHSADHFNIHAERLGICCL